MDEIKVISQVKKVKGASCETLPSGSIRVKLSPSLTGRPLQKKTFTEEDDAVDFVNKAIKELNKCEDDALNLTLTQRADAGTALRLMQQHRVKLTLTEIIRQYCDDLPSSDPILLKDAVNAYLKEQSDAVSPSHYKNMKTYLINENSFAYTYGEEWLHEVTKDDISEWLRIRCRKRSKNTYDAFLGQMRTFYNWCIAKKWLNKNLAKDIKKHNETSADPEVFTPKQAKELLQCLKDNGMDDLFLGFAIQLFSGVRRAEVLRLKWGHLNDEKIRLSRAVTKTKKGRAVPIADALKTILKEREQYLDEDFKDEPLVHIDHDTWDTQRKQLLRILKWEDWPHNGLRHSYVSYRLNIVDVYTTSYEAGHSVDVLQQHYDALVNLKDSKTYFAIEVE